MKPYANRERLELSYVPPELFLADYSRQLRIMHVAQTARGGVGTFLEEVLPLQAARYGEQAVRAVLPHEDAALFPGLAGVRLKTFPLGKADRLTTSLRMIIEALRLVRQWRPHIIHLHSTYAGLFMRAALAFFPKRPRIVYCPHGWAFDRRAPGWELACIRFVERWLSLFTDAVVCVCHDESRRAQAIGISKGRLHVVPNGIKDMEIQPRESPAELSWPPGRLKILFVGRLDAQKGVDVLYAAMKKVRGNAHAIVVGSSVVGGDAEVAPPEHVQVVGWLSRSRIAGLLAAADVLVMPSRWEAFPFVALEAMRAGLAVIASRVGGLEEIVEDGVTGFLIRSDDPEQLADVLLKVQPQQLHAMGKRGRQRYLRFFQAERSAFGLHEVYRSVSPIMRTGRNPAS